jgi:threonine dehydrogenase-like Zn-dependent dehydrogenase
MKKLVATAPRVAALADYTDVPVQPNEIKAQVLFASPKHGTEIVDFRGISPFIEENYNPEWQLFLPRAQGEKPGLVFGDLPIGNMWVGRITEKGASVTEYAVGDTVCTYGAIRETQIVNAVDNYRLRKLPAGVSYKNAVCYDPAQFALGGVRDANIRAGDCVAVIGLGAIGQIAVQLAKKAGASVVIGVDPIEKRLQIAQKYGADYCLNPSDLDIGLELKKLTQKRGVDSIIETSGHGSALQGALRGLAYGGTIAYVAFAKPFHDDLNFGREAHFNCGRIVFSRAGSEPNPDYPRWNRRRIEETCWELLTNGYLDCEEIVYPLVPFAESAEAFCKYADREPWLSIKMGITF